MSLEPDKATRVGLVALAATVMLGCTIPRGPAALPEQKPFVAVLSGEMPEPITGVARHAWIVMRVPREPYLVRWEYNGRAHRTHTDTPYFFFENGGDVSLHDVIVLEDAEASALARCFDTTVATYRKAHPDYLPIPGPNSNTYVAEALRACDVHIELPATAVGRDYLGPVGIARTEGGTGVQLETWVAGARVGLFEGVELHLVGLAFGVHVWPPGITVPVNPGRIGFTNDRPAPLEARYRHSAEHDDEADEKHVRTMAGSAWMYTSGAAIRHPSQAGGLVGRGVVGLSSRGLIGESLGYAFGEDLELGVGAPLGFAFAGHLYPVGVGYALGSMGSLALYGGAGTSFVTARVPAALELPVEARLEVDVGHLGRLGLRGRVAFLPDPGERSRHSELTLGTTARFGTRASLDEYQFADGWFFALERRELMGTAWFGASLGLEIDAERRRSRNEKVRD